jgi:hypothetical protein
MVIGCGQIADSVVLPPIDLNALTKQKNPTGAPPLLSKALAAASKASSTSTSSNDASSSAASAANSGQKRKRNDATDVIALANSKGDDSDNEDNEDDDDDDVEVTTDSNGVVENPWAATSSANPRKAKRDKAAEKKANEVKLDTSTPLLLQKAVKRGDGVEFDLLGSGDKTQEELVKQAFALASNEDEEFSKEKSKLVEHALPKLETNIMPGWVTILFAYPHHHHPQQHVTHAMCG